MTGLCVATGDASSVEAAPTSSLLLVRRRIAQTITRTLETLESDPDVKLILKT